MSRVVSRAPFRCSSAEGDDMVRSVAGYTSAWSRSRMPWSRSTCATTAARLPPAESPATAIREVSARSTSPDARTHVVASTQSCAAVGARCSGARR